LLFSLSAQPPINNSQPLHIGLALSGGGALGFAHLGVLKVLEREGIPISYITGVSMGSLIGGMYAAGYNTAQIESIATNADWLALFSSDVPFGAQYLPERQQKQRYILQLRHHNFMPVLPSGIIPLQNVEFLLSKFLANIEYSTFYDFDSLPIPYRAVAVDLVSGHKLILREGRLSQAIRASIAIPGVFAPKKIGGQELVDGGVAQLLPVEPLLEFKPDFVIASLTTKHTPETGIALIDIVSRSIDLMTSGGLDKQMQLTDILIEPNVDEFSHSDFPKAKELIAVGEKAAESILPKLTEKLANYKLVSQHRYIKPRPSSIIRKIYFTGLKITHENMLRHIIRLRPGDYLYFNELLSDLSRLFNTGLFTDVDYHLSFINDSVDLSIDLQEQAYGFYSLGIRYDNADNICAGIEVGQGNLNGSGASVRGVIQAGNPYEFRLGLNGTRLFRLPFGYRLDGFWNMIEHEYYENGYWQGDYHIEQRGGLTEAGYILGRDAFFVLGMKAYQARYQKPNLSFFNVFDGQQWIVGPSFRLEYNSFDDLYLPRHGLTYQFNGFYASRKLKSSQDFWKFHLFSEQIIPMSKRILLRYGYEIGLPFGELPLSEYYHFGGENLIGFQSDEFTTDKSVILRLATDVKLFELFNRNDYPFYLRFMGNVASFKRLDSIIKGVNINDDLHWGVGVGIRTNTPLGPFQIIIGISDFTKTHPYRGARVNVTVSVGREFRYTKD
jgi:NTE family protein